MDTDRVPVGTGEKLRKDRLVNKMTQNKSKPNPDMGKTLMSELACGTTNEARV